MATLYGPNNNYFLGEVMSKNFDDTWNAILSDVKDKLQDEELYKWIKDLKIVAFESNIITLQAKNKFVKNFVEDNFYTKIKSALKDFYHLNCDIKIVLQNSVDKVLCEYLPIPLTTL